MVAYNNLGHTRREWLRLPVPARTVSVLDATGSSLPFSTLPVPDHPELQTIVFALTLPPLGLATAFVVVAADDVNPVADAGTSGALETIENGVYRMAFDSVTGLGVSITDLRTNVTTEVCLSIVGFC